MSDNKWQQVLMIFVGATLLWSVIDPNGRRFDAIRFGEFIGAGLAFTLFGLLVAQIPAAIFRFSRGRCQNGKFGLQCRL
jgi:hypothetical protein